MDQTRDLAERLRLATEAEPVEGVPVTASFGVATSEPGALDFASLFEEADRALYCAKAGGRNRVCGAGDAPFATAPEVTPPTFG